MSVFVKQNSTSMNFHSSDGWVILSSIEQSIKQKIEKAGIPLRNWDVNIYRGILTGYNDAFIIDGATKNDLIRKDPKSAEIIRPILRGRDIKRYGYDFADLWLINVHNGIKEKGIPPINIDEYPAIKAHLRLYYDKLQKRLDQGDTPYNLRNCAYMDDFSKQKIAYNDISQKLSFVLLPEGMFMNNTVYFISYNEHIKYLLGCLNSPIYDWYYRTLSVQLGDNAVRLFSIYVLKLHIYMPTVDEELYVTQNVDLILDADKSAMEKAQAEKNIDMFLAQKYNLTAEEQHFLMN